MPLMEDIYWRAASVCAWLGTRAAYSDEVMDYLKTAGFQDYLFEDGDVFSTMARSRPPIVSPPAAAKYTAGVLPVRAAARPIHSRSVAA